MGERPSSECDFKLLEIVAKDVCNELEYLDHKEVYVHLMMQYVYTEGHESNDEDEDDEKEA